MIRTFALLFALGTTILAQAPPQNRTTQVMATLTVNPSVTRDQILKVMPQEVRDTVQIYLDGRILQWYGRADGKGVVFILDCKSIDEAKALLNQLPLIKDKLATFEYLALSPLTPLRFLLQSQTP